jgi:DHA2 family multidrug resistance protein
VIANTIIQGAGLGFVFIPLQVIAFATLAPALRTDATSLFSLMRNVGSAVGVSATFALLAHNIQVVHADLAARVTPFNAALRGNPLFDPATAKGAAMLDTLINQQATIIAYLDDFKAMLFVTAPAVLLLLLMRRPPAHAAPDMSHAAMD